MFAVLLLVGGPLGVARLFLGCVVVWLARLPFFILCALVARFVLLGVVTFLTFLLIALIALLVLILIRLV